MALQLTLSCELNQSQTGPTLIHSTGVEHYKIPPAVIRILQKNISNDLLSDHDQGVLCQEGPQQILGVLRQNGFTLQKQTTDTDRALWTVVQSGGDDDAPHHPVHPPAPEPTPDGGDGGAEAGGEDQGENDEEEGHGEDEEEEGEE